MAGQAGKGQADLKLQAKTQDSPTAIVAPREQQRKASPAALGMLSVALASTAITMAVRPPPPGLGGNAYDLALLGTFFAGAAGALAAVWVADDPRGRRAAGRKLACTSVATLAVAFGLSVVSLL